MNCEEGVSSSLSKETYGKPLSNLVLRPAHNTDQPGIIALINAVYQEYGDEVFLEGAESDLLEIDETYFRNSGCFVVLVDKQKQDELIKGTHAVLPLDPANNLCTFRRLYLAPDLRGTGAGTQLMQWAIDWASEAGFTRVEFWSDVRFKRAHRFFQRFDFQTDFETREMNDGCAPYQEYLFWRELT